MEAMTELNPASASGQNPTQMQLSAYLMSAPFSYTTSVANNVWMEEYDELERQVDDDRAMKQFLALYHFVSADALVYLLPSPSGCGLQDLVFTANLGLVLEHLPDQNTVVLANFSSAPRVGETELGRRFFSAMGYDVQVPPFRFEGEAELKHLYDNVYVGGFGLRTERAVYPWMERNFDMKVIAVEERDPRLYHLDGSIFPIDRENTIVCTEAFSGEELAALARHTNIIDVSLDLATCGICNSVRLGNTIMNSSHILELRRGTEDYQFELEKNRRLEDIAVNLGFEVSFFNLSEYHKAGALLSCMIMHLNRHSYQIALL